MTPQTVRWREEMAKQGMALALYLGLALLMTWPMALQMTTAVPGNGFDTWQNMWNIWWLREALLTGSNPFFTPYLYYPHGAGLWLQTLNPINFLISLPIHALFGLVAAYNFVVLFSLTMSGYAAYLLARGVLAENGSFRATSHRAALIAGVIFACSGYLLAQVLGSHTHMLAAWPLPLAALALHRAANAPGRGRITLAGALIALTALCDWQYLLFTLIWAAWYAVARLLSHQPAGARGGPLPRLRASGALAVMAAIGVALLLVAPFAIPTARFASQTPGAESEGGPTFRLEHSADLADFFIPSQIHPLLGPLAERLQTYKAETHIQNKTVYLGFVALALAALGVRGRAGRFWLLGGLLFALLALGPQLQILGWRTGLPLPGALIYELPLVKISRYPIRFAVYATLALAILAALGAQRLLAALEGRAAHPTRAANLALAGLVALIAFENLTTPFPIVRVYVPSLYAALGRDPERYAILESPFYYNTSPVYMLFQVVHGKYLAGGYTSRRLPYPLVEQIPTVRMFAYAEPAPDIITQEPARIAASVFSYFNIRYLMLHSAGGALRYGDLQTIAAAAAGGAKPRREPSMLAYSDTRSASGLLRAMGPFEPPVTGSVLAYRVVPPDDPLPFLGLGGGWSPPRVTPAGVERYISDEAEVLIYSARPRRVTLELDLTSPVAGQLEVRVNGANRVPLSLPDGRSRQRFILDIESGMTRLHLRPLAAGALVVRGVGLES
ncbi:MAG: hypothetical protein RMK84_11805 [Oscillochloridaceae bacterium]|nr:hypothetical protein [Chloroflexaceae bacterium]MDW8390801.1 hypothetical protein [Oscillochloridaceae bacterium]